ncbi:hypothetical protein [Tellurirhabdus rosea]|uniref:hypothetical protein n=1 Tax=Tellurirhabdus rosea TaxID=2674997 RepID=UPI00225868B3|nr:hypothetical protein [Tellurirhabdus rosea]
MKKTLLGFCFSSLIFLSSSAFAQTSTETWSSEGLGTLGGENIKTAAEIKKLLIGTWVLNDDPKQTVTFTATTVTFRVKGLSQKPSTYKMEDEC